MNKKVLIAGAISLIIGVVIVFNRAAVRTPASNQLVGQNSTGAVLATPNAKSEQVKVELTGITTILNVKRALLRVSWPAGTSTREESYILSEGESKDGITLDSVDAANGLVTLRVLEVARAVRLEKGV